ncbi:MAG: hypothetical protein HZB33_14205 [Nitrospirae bacterium]|nr:hypothetical protein [Nitrospirota bacterium]
MAKKSVREKELLEFMHSAGCREITENDKKTEWYKKASKKTACLKTAHKEKAHR